MTTASLPLAQTVSRPPADRAGEERITQFARDHGPALLGYAQRLVNGDSHLAEDIVQETMARAWLHPEAFRPGRGSARAWLFSVAHNLAMDAHRRRERAPEVVSDELPPTATADHADALLLSIEVRAALAGLSADHRSVVVQLHLHGHSVAEVAGRLRVPVGTVKSRAFYALRHLSAILRQRGLDPSLR